MPSKNYLELFFSKQEKRNNPPIAGISSSAAVAFERLENR
jgi:hypothetical protein